jgi:hypothetical protein
MLAPVRFVLKLVGAIVGGIVVLAVGLVGLLLYFEWLGGMPSSYRAVDHDRRLTGVAREAVPLIAAIDAFYKNHGACPQPDRAAELAEFRAGLTDGYTAESHGRFVVLQQPHVIPGWIYDTSEAHAGACSLWRKLGWDPALIWRRDGDQTGWVFDPGDGNDERPLRLDAGPAR